MADDARGSTAERVGMASNRVGFGDAPAVVVVDLQRYLTRPDSPIGADLAPVVERTNELVGLAREADAPVVFVRQVPYPGGERVGKWRKVAVDPSVTDPEDGEGQLDERLDVRDADQVVDKLQASAFHETRLDSLLTSYGVDTVVVAGCSTSGCVRATALGSCARGYRTVVPQACVGDRSPAQHEANLHDVDARIGDVVTMAEVREHLATVDE